MVLIRNASFPGPRGGEARARRPEGDLLGDIRAFLRRHKMDRGPFGRDACGQWDLVNALERGRTPRAPTVAAIRQFMRRMDERAGL